MNKRWTLWDISLLALLIISLGLLLFPLGVHGINYLRVKNGMSWEVAESVFDHRIYGAHYGYHDGIKYKFYTLSGPAYIVLKITGKIFNKQWDYACAVAVRYENQKVIGKLYMPFRD